MNQQLLEQIINSSGLILRDKRCTLDTFLEWVHTPYALQPFARVQSAALE